VRRISQVQWQPVSRGPFLGWLVFYVLLLWFLGLNFRELTLLDNVHLPIHEGGHLLFGYLGETLGLWGGTIMQLLVPALLAVSFAVRRELPGTTFCAMAFFHSLTGVGTYMSDALRLELPLVTAGAVADESQHDWLNIFTRLGVLPHAIRIGNTVTFVAWCGMLATVAWFTWRYFQQSRLTETAA
jgi:hypothetical protein